MAYLVKNRNWDSSNKVAAIKAVRSITGVGLKEAKDAVESAAEGNAVPIDSHFNPRETIHARAISDLKGYGFDLSARSTKSTIVLESVKQGAILAAKDEDFDLAKLLLNVLTEYEIICDQRIEKDLREAEQRRIEKHDENMRQEEREQAQIATRERLADVERKEADNIREARRMHMEEARASVGDEDW